MLDPNTLSSLKVTELKAELKKRGLPVGGLKHALVERLAEQVIQERAAEAEAIAQAAAEEEEEEEEEEEPAESQQGEEVVNGDEEVAPEPQPEPQPEPIPEVVEEKREVVPFPQTAPEAIVETTQAVAIEENVVEPEVIQEEEAPKPEAPTEVEPATIEIVPEPAPEPETEAVIATEVMEEEVSQEKIVEPEVVERASDPEAKLGIDPVEAEVVEKVREEEASELAAEPEAKSEDEMVGKGVLEEVTTTKIEIASDEIPGTGPTIGRKEEAPAAEQSISEFKQGTEMERVRPEEHVIAAAKEPVREIAGDEDSKMVDVSSHSPPAEKSIVPEPTPVQGDTAAESTSKTNLHQASIDPMDTSEDIRKRKRHSIPQAPPSARVDEPESQRSDEGTISKKPRRDSTENQPQRTRPRDARFKGLFNDSSSAITANNPPAASHHYSQATDQAMNQPTTQIEDEDDTPIPPSIHPATRALYIRNFARPLSEPALKAHLTALASTPSSTSTATTSQPSESPIEYLYLDTIKTHALIIFTTLTAATRVRVGIHTKIWPNERSRKPLWADFVPEESVAGWVDRERQRGAGARWEVVYDREVGEGGVRAELEEVGGRRRVGPGGNVGVEVLGAPTGPRGERRNTQIAERDFGSLCFVYLPLAFSFFSSFPLPLSRETTINLKPSPDILPRANFISPFIFYRCSNYRPELGHRNH